MVKNAECTSCHVTLEIEDDYFAELQGKEIDCPQCSAKIAISPQSTTKLTLRHTSGCPACKAFIAEGTVVCVQCGYDFRTRKRIPLVAEQPISSSTRTAFLFWGVLTIAAIVIVAIAIHGKMNHAEPLTTEKPSASRTAEPAPIQDTDHPKPIEPQDTGGDRSAFVAPASIKGAVHISYGGFDLPLKQIPIYLIPFTDAFQKRYNALASQALPLIRGRESTARFSQEWVRFSERLIEVEKQRAIVFREHTSRTLYADNNGMFAFHDLTPGTYMVFVEGTIKDRITIWSLLIDLVSGDSVSLDFNDSNVGNTEVVYAFAGLSSVPTHTSDAAPPKLSGNQLSDMAIAAANRGDHKKAIDLLRAGADAGHALCQYNLGASYIDGIGVPQDYGQAVYWYQKAAQQGLAVAQKKLGLCFYRGVGLAPDTRQAVYWFGQAAQQGDQEAMQVLDEIAYEDAKVRGAQKSPPDQDAAEYFLTKAADTIVQMKIASGQLISARRRGVQFQYVRGNPQCDANAQVDYEFTFTTQAGLTRRNVGYLFFYHDPRRRDWFNSDTNIDGLPRYGR